MPTLEKQFTSEIAKVSDELGLILGWALITKEAGETYVDLQHEAIDEAAMIRAAAEFMREARVMKIGHSGEAAGDVVFCFPMTAEVAKAFGMTTQREGLLLGVMPHDQQTLDDAREGRLAGFSIGGLVREAEEAE